MRILTASAALAAVALVGACSKPSDPSNPPVAAEQNQPVAAPTSGDNSFTEAQARGHIENAGYTDVTGLTQDDKGAWTGTAMKDGQSVKVSVDYTGGVTAG
jgi:putative membrane protein